MSRQHHHNTRGRCVNYVAMNGGNGEVEDSQDELLEEQEPPSDWEDHGASDSAAVQSGFTSSMAAQHSAAAPLGRASPLEMDDAELDRRLAAAEDESIHLEREEEKARKIRRLAELEGRNRERRRRIHEDAQAPECPEPRGLPPAAEPRRQRTVNMADLRQDPHVDCRAGALLRTLSLVLDSDSEPDCVASDQRRRSTKRGRRLRSGMEARVTDVVINPQFWPHVALPLEQVGKSFAFAELDLRLLVAGELEIIPADSVSRCEKEGRLGLLKDVTYIAGNLGWQAAKNIYSAVVRKIELGLLQWDSDFSSVCQVVLLKAQH